MLRYPEAWQGTEGDSVIPNGKHHTLIRCAVARSVMGAARASGVPADMQCEATLLVVERWCNERATAAELIAAERELTLLRVYLVGDQSPAGAHRVRMCDAALRACEEARACSSDRGSKLTLM